MAKAKAKAGGGSAKKVRDAKQRTKKIVATFKIGGVDFVVLSKQDYLATGAPQPGGSVQGHSPTPNYEGAATHSSLVKQRLFDARRHSGLSQAGLAKRLGKSQAFVSLAESGRAVVGDRYLRAVLDACGLPSRWGAVKQKRLRKTHDQLERSEIAGFDPETLLAVQIGSKRDKELAKKYVWWMNGRALRW